MANLRDADDPEVAFNIDISDQEILEELKGVNGDGSKQSKWAGFSLNFRV